MSGCRTRDSTPPALCSPRTVARAQHLDALILSLQGAQGRQLRHQLRAQRPEVWARGAPRRCLRESPIPAARQGSVQSLFRPCLRQSRPPAPPPARRTPSYPRVCRSRDSAASSAVPASAPSMEGSPPGPARAPFRPFASSAPSPHPPRAVMAPTNQRLLAEELYAPIGARKGGAYPLRSTSAVLQICQGLEIPELAGNPGTLRPG